MATTQLTASSISTRNLSSFEGFRTSAIQFPRNNARIGILSQRSFPSMVVKAAATVVTPKVLSLNLIIDIYFLGTALLIIVVLIFLISQILLLSMRLNIFLN
jgi:hypothetical protein